LKAGFDPDDIVKNICAFANDLNGWGGGYLILGCSEKDGRPVLPPVGLSENKMNEYQLQMKGICNQLDPYYWPVMKPCKYGDRSLLMLWVPVGDRRPYTAPERQSNKSQKVHYVRNGSQTRIPNAVEQARLLEQASRVKFESAIHPEAPLEAISRELIINYLSKTKSILFEDAESMSLEELCNSLMLAKRIPGDQLRPINLGLLLFCDKPEVYFPGAFVEIVFFNDDDATDIREELVFSGPVNKQLDEVLNFFERRVIATKQIPAKPKARAIQNYPIVAIREAVVNALYHRSYEVDNKVEIAIRPSSIQILSFQGPPPSVTEATLLQERQDVHDYRNPVLGSFLKDFGLAEKRATGLKRIRKELAKNGSRGPTFDIGDHRTHFKIVMNQHPDWEADRLNFDIPTSDDIVPEAKASVREQVILEAGLTGASIGEISNALGGQVSKRDIAEMIQLLVAKEYLVSRVISFGFGLFKKQLYLTTTVGQKVLSQSF